MTVNGVIALTAAYNFTEFGMAFGRIT